MVGNAGDVQVHNPTDGAILNGFARIRAVNKHEMTEFARQFKLQPGSSRIAPDVDIYAYYGKNLGGHIRAAALYNASPARIPGNLIENTGRVLQTKGFTRDFNMLVDGDITALSQEIKNKADAADTVRLQADKDAAVARIKAKMVNDPEGKSDLKNEEIKDKMNETTPNLIGSGNDNT
jgi:hypothetical protein